MASIPVDILRNILEHVDRAGLLKMCLVNKICCSCSQDVLYREIFSKDNRICRTLVKSSHLAKRVRSFSLYAHEEELAKVLRNLTSLRSLALRDEGSVSNLMDGCTFKLESLSCFYDIDESLHKFLCSQPGLTTLRFFAIDMKIPELETTCLPNLTHLTAWFPHIPNFIRGRPVNDLTVMGIESMVDVDFGDHDFDYSVLSSAPIHKLWISYEFLFPTPAPILASITPSLVHLSLIFPERFIRPFKTGFNEWLETLLANLVTLRTFHVDCTSTGNFPPLEEYLPFIMGVSNQAPHLEYFAITYGTFHCWKRVCEEWVICDKPDRDSLVDL